MARGKTLSDSAKHERRLQRYGGVGLWMAIGAGLIIGRIATITSPEGDTAFLSANDRSRWATVISLVDRGTYRIDDLVAIRNPVHRNRRPFDSIDKVRHIGADGRQHFYSSKPPLLATIVAGVYWVIQSLTGLRILAHPVYVPRIILVGFNVPVYLALVWATHSACRSIRRLWSVSSTTSWPIHVTAASISIATMLTPMAVSLNNHLVAAASTAVALAMFLKAARRQSVGTTQTNQERGINAVRIAICGLASGMAAANELPALTLVAGLLVMVGYVRILNVIPYTMGVAAVAVAFFGTTYIAHGSWRIPYAHRGVGPRVGVLEGWDGSKLDANLDQSIGQSTQVGDVTLSVDAIVRRSDDSGRWRIDDTNRSYAVLVEDGSADATVYRWDDWYEYPESYWRDGKRSGVDVGEPRRATYLFHMLLGHHGIFSITPIWILAAVGLVIGVRPRGKASQTWLDRTAKARDRIARLTMMLVIAMTLTCIVFYVRRPEIDRNYGGVSCCFRWLLWLAPAWMLGLGNVVSRYQDRPWMRSITSILIGLSVFSVSIAMVNPWDSPWMYRWLEFLGYLATPAAS